jgi:hypothetical protein
MNPTSLAARNTVAGNKVAASPESCVREVGSFLFTVEQSTPQIFDNLQRREKKVIYLKFAQTACAIAWTPASERLRLLTCASDGGGTEQRQPRVHHVG